MGIMVYSVLWVMQDLYHQPYGSGPLKLSSALPRPSWQIAPLQQPAAWQVIYYYYFFLFLFFFWGGGGLGFRVLGFRV